MDGMLDTDLGDLLLNMVDFQIDRFVADLRQMITDWESWNQEDTFYPLAIYRIIDMIEEQTATDRLPVLETGDTPDE